ncbi:MAG: M50 family metallopeptidase [Fimbriimonadaceae bacterium]|nr:MAG: M50 family metallopeptidase [Fimbriimonadaceae bacterium]
MTKSQKLLLLASAASILLWAVPVLRIAILPLIYLNTHFHELAHALAAWISGGSPERILVFADGSGVTPILGGNAILVGSAGYMGTAILGSILILNGRTEKKARTALKTLSILLGLSLILLVKGDIAGVLSAIFWIPALWLLGSQLKGDSLKFAVKFIGLQMSLTAFHAVLTLFEITAATDEHSDAMILQQATYISDVVWAFGWVVFAVLLAGFTLRSVWIDNNRT